MITKGELRQQITDLNAEVAVLKDVVEKQHALIIKSYKIMKGILPPKLEKGDLDMISKAHDKRERKKAAALNRVKH